MIFLSLFEFFIITVNTNTIIKNIFIFITIFVTIFVVVTPLNYVNMEARRRGFESHSG